MVSTTPSYTRPNRTIGIYFSQINQLGINPLPRWREQQLARVIQKPGQRKDRRQKAINTLVTANLKLVRFTANKYFWYVDYGSELFCEIISAGNIGLMLAAERFKPIGTKFSTIATIIIRTEMTRARITNRKAVRPGHHIYQKFSAHFIHHYNSLVGSLGREPTEEELIAKTGFDTDTIGELLAVLNGVIVRSLDKPLYSSDGESRETGLGRLADRKPDIDNSLDNHYEVERRLAPLSGRREEVMRLCLGHDPEFWGTGFKPAEAARIIKDRHNLKSYSTAAATEIRRNATRQMLQSVAAD